MRLNSLFVSLLAINFSVHLLRFPHLILENGGGAFLILFFLSLNIISLPLLIAEKALGNKLENIEARSLILLKNSTLVSHLDRVLILSWLVLRMAILSFFLAFFLFVSGTSLIYLGYFVVRFTGVGNEFIDLPSLPDMSMSYLSAFLWVSFLFGITLFSRKKVHRAFTYILMPFSGVVLLGLIIKVIFAVDDFGGFRLLFYPDFSSLRPESLQQLVGHSLAVFFIGFGFYDHLKPSEEMRDPIEFFIQLIVQALLLAILIGVMAIPLMEQVRELPFGANWVFEILPRWLSYGEFGFYYCALFFLAISIMTSFVSTKLIEVLKRNLKFLSRNQLSFRWSVSIAVTFILINSFLLPFFQQRLHGWTGQSLLLMWDNILVNWLMPLSAIIMLWVLFRYTREKERMQVFDKQNVFFHNRYFFYAWQKGGVVLIPLVILVSWILTLRGN